MQLLPGIQSLANSGLCLESLQRERVEVAPRGQGSLLPVISLCFSKHPPGYSRSSIQQELCPSHSLHTRAHTGTQVGR